MKYVTLALLLFSSISFASEFDGYSRSYKPAEHSSTIHNRLTGESAREFYKLMVNVPEVDLPNEQVSYRKSAQMECLNFYGDGYYECRFRITEDGKVEGGY